MQCSVALDRDEAPGFQTARSELYRIYWDPLYAYKSLGDRSAKKGNVLTRGFFSRMIEDKRVGRVDPSMHSRALNHYVRPADARLASRSAFVPPHLQGSVAVTRAMIP